MNKASKLLTNADRPTDQLTVQPEPGRNKIAEDKEEEQEKKKGR